MDFVIQKEVLANGIQLVQNAITQKSSLQILSNVLIECRKGEVKLTATDLEICISAMIPVISGEDGEITVPAKKFFDIVRALPDNSEAEVSVKKNNSVGIKSGKASFKVIGLPKDEFPPIPMFEDKDSITVPQKTLKEMLNLTDFAASKEDARHVLTGILLEVKGDEVVIVATDGRRMAVVNRTLQKKSLVNKKVIVPLKTVQEVKRVLSDDGDLKIQFSENQVMFSFPSSFIISRLIEGEYPDYKKVIPEKAESVIEVLREDFLNATKRVSIFTDQESQAVKISILKDKMVISKKADYLGEAEEEIKVKYSGTEEIKIGFNPRYLMDVLRNMDEPEIKFEVNGYNRPGVIRKGNEYTYVVLPMQLPV